MDEVRQAPEIERYMTVRDVAAWLQLPIGTVYCLTRQGVLPHLRIGRAIRYRQSEVSEALRALGRSAPVAEAQ